MAVKYGHLIKPISTHFMWRGGKLLEESGSYLIELMTIYWLHDYRYCI